MAQCLSPAATTSAAGYGAATARTTTSLGHPLADVLHPGALGRGSVYDAFAPTPPDGSELDATAEAETCLGVGAHTHYFEPDQQVVAWLIDYLLRSRYTVSGGSRDGSGTGVA